MNKRGMFSLDRNFDSNVSILRDSRGRFLKGHLSYRHLKGWISPNRLMLDGNKVKNLYFNELKNPKDIGRLFNCSSRPIWRILKEEGVKFSNSERSKILYSKGIKQKPHGMLNLHHKEETKKRISKIIKQKISNGKIIVHNKGKTMENYEPLRRAGEKLRERWKDKINHPRYGIPRPDLTKRNIENNCMNNPKTRRKASESHKKRYKDDPNLIKVFTERRLRQTLPIKDTSIEVKIQNFLKQLGVTFFTHQTMNQIKHRYQCDILIPSMNRVIECDGDYWHKYPIGREIDRIRTSELIQKGFKVLRLWECEIRKMDINKFEAILKQ